MSPATFEKSQSKNLETGEVPKDSWRPTTDTRGTRHTQETTLGTNHTSESPILHVLRLKKKKKTTLL